jgi:hypothetical protein
MEVTDLQGVSMDADRVVDDIVLVAYVFNDPEEFVKAMHNVVDVLRLIVQQRNIGEELKGAKAGWHSFHFQSQRIQRHKADMRMVYQDSGTTIRVKGFGHRWIPEDLYQRLSNL